ncbi:LytR/AlgR family response regulator transcription factor [Arsenicibacter rosenii]|uniref:DNA-binding response regulator n=1 Tax=Arsenicibacter rosenii TaxID=1750698 RepID=A0A1S2VBD6_9BACT|nr:LytTR family DNA-binding domain-containing protein [Arsenicibacter rosenii]OIN55526.1 DNA-binding response regulator [Arsenicibacter rosenii]
MNVVIVEDERLTAQRLQSLLLKYSTDMQVLAILPSIELAIPWFRQYEESGQQPLDLVFMDIHLQDGLAFRIIEQVQLTTPIIFTTAYDEYMIQAFKVNSIDYLLKPIALEDLTAAIDKFKAFRDRFTKSTGPVNQYPQRELEALLQQLGKTRDMTYKNRFMVSIGPKIYSIETADTAYFYLADRATMLVTCEGMSLPVEYSLEKLGQLLNPDEFFRISRQFIISRKSIQSILAYSAGKLKLELLPKSQTEVFVSGERVTDFKEWLGK